MHLRDLIKSPVWISVALVLIWLWPIGLGGKMPVGGDVTQFSIGLMAELSRALHAGRLPYWNALWGFGFPGIGESQMGVYYPPHWFFYGLFSVEVGYTLSLVFHTILGTLGVYWGGRGFGISKIGSAFSAVAWSTCGFFWIHLAHQWSYTTAAWMPWAWGLTWVSLNSKAHQRSSFWLSIVLAMQLLPGHFQLAFITQVSVALLFVSQLIRDPRNWRPLLATGFAVSWAFLLAGLQLWPTLRLARLASVSRDFEYLSGFAASPLHLITFIAPGLFEVSPLWRPIIWDPFHTSPEEYLGFVGIVPLFLAWMGLTSGFSQRPEIRSLALVGLGTIWLALGPYVPGFEGLCHLPGFSFFRSPSRWILATSLVLAFLSGFGFDSLASGERESRSLIGFVGVCLLAILCVIATIEVGLGVSKTATSRPSTLSSFYEKTLNSLPWSETGVYQKILHDAGRVNSDLRVQETWARQGVRLKQAPPAIFLDQRFAIYREELLGTLSVLLALPLLLVFANRKRIFLGGLFAIGILDLFWNGRTARIDYGPIDSLVRRSPVLSELAKGASSPKTLDTLRNLPMVAGAAPVFAYRTLDLPILSNLTYLSLGLPINPDSQPLEHKAAEILGVASRIYDPREVREMTLRGLVSSVPIGGKTLQDPSLAAWKFGADWVTQNEDWASTFVIMPISKPGIIGWLLQATPDKLAKVQGGSTRDPLSVVDFFDGAAPLKIKQRTSTSLEIELPRISEKFVDEPRLVVLCQLDDPQWKATIDAKPVDSFRAFGVRGEGAWTAFVVGSRDRAVLELKYDASDVRQGWWISGVALMVWGAALGWTYRSARGTS